MELQGLPEGLPENVRLIERYLSQEINAEEQAMLDAWINESPEHRAFFESVTNRETLLQSLKEYADAKVMAEDAKAQVWEMIRNEQTPVRSIRSRSRYWAVAAAAILIIGVGAYLWYGKEEPATVAVQQKTQQPVNNDAAPGSYKARLTLADGSTIVLDSAAAGKLAQQGNTEIINQSGGLTYAPATPSGAIVYNTLTTAKGEIYKLQLSDGSKIWLNSASSVRYPVAFAGKERRVEITGEAYFEVAHLENSMPFKISVNGMEVKVLGTHFNINAYADEARIRTTLLKGSVAVTPAGNTKPVILKPGQQAGVTGTAVDIIPDADTEQAVAWKNGYFQFLGEDLRTIMRQLERWYDVEVVYEGSIPDRRFAGKIPRNTNASQVLTALQSMDVHFRIEGKKIIVTP